MIDAKHVLDLARAVSEIEKALYFEMRDEREAGRFLQVCELMGLREQITDAAKLVRPLRFLVDWDRFNKDKEDRRAQSATTETTE